MAACILLVVVTMLVLFVVHFGRSFFSSDDAVVNMLAENMWQQGRLLPRGWIDNNGDLMMPSIALIVAPLLAWFPNGFGIHSVGGVFAVILMLGSLMWLLRTLAMPWTVVFFVATLMASGFCRNFVALIYTQTTYVWWPAGFFIGAALIHRQRSFRSATAPATVLRTTLLFALVFSISFANPSRVLVMMVMPLYVFDCVLRAGYSTFPPCETRFRSWLSIAGLGDTLTAIGIVASFVFATALYAALVHVGTIRPVYGAAALFWDGWPSVWRHLRTFESWFTYFGAPSATYFASIRTIDEFAFFRWITALWLTWIAASEIVKLCKQADVVRRALASAMLAAYVLIAIPYVLLEPLAVDGSTLRYFIVPNCIAVVLAAFPLRHLLSILPAFASAGMLLAGALLALVAAPLYIPVATIGTAEFGKVGESATMRLARILQREDLQWGYATWWNAGATMVHTDSSIRIWPVDFYKGGLASASSMISMDWYRPGAWRGSTFLVVSDRDKSRSEMIAARMVLGEPIRTIDGGGFSILVFDHNISADFYNARSPEQLVADGTTQLRSKNPMRAGECLSTTAATADGRAAQERSADAAPSDYLPPSIFSWNVPAPRFYTTDSMLQERPPRQLDPVGIHSSSIFRSCFE